MSKDSLVPQSAGQKNAYTVTGKDFPAKVAGKYGDEAGEADALVKQSTNQVGPRLNEGEGGSADSMTARTAAVSKAFSVSRNGGESQSAASTPSMGESVSLESGQISVKGVKRTRKGETPDQHMSIG